MMNLSFVLRELPADFTPSTSTIGPNMRIRSRTTRRLDAFDRKFDAAVTRVLLDANFTEVCPYVFERASVEGRDVIHFDIEDKSFIVFMAYKPAYMEEIDILFRHLLVPNQPELGAFSFLTPKCMTHRPKEFPCANAAARDRSLAMVSEGLQTHALDWLASLHDPIAYAEAVAPSTLMYVGRSNEVAGRLVQAREAYERQMNALLACWEIATFNQFVNFSGSREFVYLCKKLNLEPEKCELVMDAIKFCPEVSQLINED